MERGVAAGGSGMRSRLVLTRSQVLGFRRRVGALDERLPAGERSLRQAAWAGLQDSMPRAALLSIHARVEGAEPATWEDPSLVQVWGPRYQVYVVAACDRAVFTLGRLPDDGKGRRRAEDMAARLHAHLDGARMGYGEAGRGLGVHHNALRYGATTGTVVIRWDGARQPTVWTTPASGIDPLEARSELARRHLRVFGPSNPAAFARWAGISLRAGAAAFASLEESLTAVRTPLGDGWILAADEPLLRADPAPAAPARLLPSGDAYFLLQGAERALLVPDAGRRGALWTPRVWPGAILLDGEIRGTWRRAHDTVTVETWGRCSRAARSAVEAEAAALPLPGIERGITVRWQPGPTGGVPQTPL
jgi:DNA glycosylase AlkZ-like